MRLGKISYGVYLFHWPIFVVINDERMGFDGVGLLLVRLGMTFAAAHVSFTFFEHPIRKMSTITVRPTIALAGAATAVAILAAVIVVPGRSDDYWTTSDDIADAAALDTDDAPLLVVGPSAPVSTTTPRASAPTTVSSADAASSGRIPDASREPDDSESDGEASTNSTSAVGTVSEAPPALPQAAPALPQAAPALPQAAPALPEAAPALPELSRPVRIIVAGDSTGAAFGAGIVSWAAASPNLGQAELFAAAGCGFLRDGEFLAGDTWKPVANACATWIEKHLPERVAEAGADVVVMITTVWDVLDHRWDDGPGLATTTDEMHARLLFDYTRATEDLLAGGAESVVWVKAPIPDPFWLPRFELQEQPERHAALHDVMDEVAANHPGDVYVVDLLEYFDEQGLTLDRDVRPDGIHVSPEAADQIATDYLGEQLVRAALDSF